MKRFARITTASALLIGLGGAWAAIERVSAQGAQVPQFQVEPLWPQPFAFEKHMTLGSVTGVTVDSLDHVWVTHRGLPSLQANEKGPTAATWAGECCFAAPLVLEFDQTGKLLNNWGGSSANYVWPQNPGGITVDGKGNVWIPAQGLPAAPAGGGRGGRGAPAAAPAAGAGAPTTATPPAGDAGGRGAGRGGRGGGAPGGAGAAAPTGAPAAGGAAPAAGGAAPAAGAGGGGRGGGRGGGGAAAGGAAPAAGGAAPQAGGAAPAAGAGGGRGGAGGGRGAAPAGGAAPAAQAPEGRGGAPAAAAAPPPPPPPPPADAHILKFSKTGQFIAQFGVPGNVGSPDVFESRNGPIVSPVFNGPTSIAVDDAANEAYVADNGNRRIMVIDATTGAHKRHWFGSGEKTSSPAPPPYSESAAPPKGFRDVSCVKIAKDGMVYVCDSASNRIQVFRKDGTFVKEGVVKAGTGGVILGGAGNTIYSFGSAWDVAFSSDPAQKFMYVADGMNKTVWVMDRQSLQVVSRVGQGGRYPGTFYALSAVAVDSRGNLYTGEESDGKRVQKFVNKGLGAPKPLN